MVVQCISAHKFVVIISPANKVLWGLKESHCLLVRLSVQMSCNCNFFLTDEPILMELKTATVYNMRMYMNEGDFGLE